jgi:hypothetical protein
MKLISCVTKDVNISHDVDSVKGCIRKVVFFGWGLKTH